MATLKKRTAPNGKEYWDLDDLAAAIIDLQKGASKPATSTRSSSSTKE